jgi:hypothetical protein
MRKKRSNLSALEGLLLWEVHFKSSYYDNDPRMPGDVPVDERLFVLAKSHSEAMKKSESWLNELMRKWGENSEVTATVIALENLVPARNSKNDGRMGWISQTPFSPVKLSLDEDKSRFRLAVSLVPIEE